MTDFSEQQELFVEWWWWCLCD